MALTYVCTLRGLECPWVGLCKRRVCTVRSWGPWCCAGSRRTLLRWCVRWLRTEPRQSDNCWRGCYNCILKKRQFILLVGRVSPTHFYKRSFVFRWQVSTVNRWRNLHISHSFGLWCCVCTRTAREPCPIWARFRAGEDICWRVRSTNTTPERPCRLWRSNIFLECLPVCPEDHRPKCATWWSWCANWSFSGDSGPAPSKGCRCGELGVRLCKWFLRLWTDRGPNNAIHTLHRSNFPDILLWFRGSFRHSCRQNIDKPETRIIDWGVWCRSYRWPARFAWNRTTARSTWPLVWKS